MKIFLFTSVCRLLNLTTTTAEAKVPRLCLNRIGTVMLLALVPLCFAITGCKLTPDPTLEAAVDKLFKERKQKYENGGAKPKDGAETASSGSESGDSQEATSLESELDLWKDPEFKKRFTESYIAETDIEPDVTEDERDTMLEVFDLMEEDKMEEAADLLERNRGKAASAVFDFTLANIWFQQEKVKKSANAYSIAVEKYPRFLRAWRNLGIILVRLKKYDRAVKALTRVIELGGGDARTYGLLGYSYASLQNSLCAESAYRMAILLDPDELDWKMGLVQSFFRQERYAEAVAICNRLIEDYPDNADPWMWQANAYIGLNKPLMAAENYEFINQLGKSTYDTLSMLGNIYVNEGLHERAVDCYVWAMEKKPTRKIDAVLRAARVLTANSAYEETERLIENIEKIKGDKLQVDDRQELLKLQARVAVAQGKTGRHVEILKETIEVDPMDGEALLLLGRHYAHTGNPEEAIFYFERAAKIEGFKADALVQHAQLLVKDKKYDKAIPLLEKAQKIEPRENVKEYLEQIKRIAKAH